MEDVQYYRRSSVIRQSSVMLGTDVVVAMSRTGLGTRDRTVTRESYRLWVHDRKSYRVYTLAA